MFTDATVICFLLWSYVVSTIRISIFTSLFQYLFASSSVGKHNSQEQVAAIFVFTTHVLLVAANLSQVVVPTREKYTMFKNIPRAHLSVQLFYIFGHRVAGFMVARNSSSSGSPVFPYTCARLLQSRYYMVLFHIHRSLISHRSNDLYTHWLPTVTDKHSTLR